MNNCAGVACGLSNEPLLIPSTAVMIFAHPCVLMVMDVYGNVDTSYHLPWFLKVSLIGLAVRAVFWVIRQFSET